MYNHHHHTETERDIIREREREREREEREREREPGSGWLRTRKAVVEHLVKVGDGGYLAQPLFVVHLQKLVYDVLRNGQTTQVQAAATRRTPPTGHRTTINIALSQRQVTETATRNAKEQHQ